MGSILNSELPEFQASVSVAELVGLAERASSVLDQIRDRLLAPHPRKIAPTFSSAKVAALCGIDKQKFFYLAKKGDLQLGTSNGPGRRKDYSLEETIACVQEIKKPSPRPEGKRGRVFIVSNFKGGVGKSTTAVSLAQAMTLLGRKVLLVDSDPQGTATQLCGYAPDAEITDERTLLPLIYDKEPNLFYAIQKTYWHNLDLIPASSSLFDAEFEIPGKRLTQSGYEFWNIVRRGLLPVAEQYDAIIIDTPPSLSYLTLNALIAADSVIMPCPPEALDFASSCQFWNLFSDLASKLPGIAENKKYDFVGVLPTKVRSVPISGVVKTWMSMAYGEKLMPIEIPSSEVPSGASAQLSTVYDFTRPMGSTEAYNRFKDPMDRLAQFIDDQLVQAWRRSEQ